MRQDETSWERELTRRGHGFTSPCTGDGGISNPLKALHRFQIFESIRMGRGEVQNLRASPYICSQLRLCSKTLAARQQAQLNDIQAERLKHNSFTIEEYNVMTQPILEAPVSLADEGIDSERLHGTLMQRSMLMTNLATVMLGKSIRELRLPVMFTTELEVQKGRDEKMLHMSFIVKNGKNNVNGHLEEIPMTLHKERDKCPVGELKCSLHWPVDVRSRGWRQPNGPLDFIAREGWYGYHPFHPFDEPKEELAYREDHHRLMNKMYEAAQVRCSKVTHGARVTGATTMAGDGAPIEQVAQVGCYNIFNAHVLTTYDRGIPVKACLVAAGFDPNLTNSGYYLPPMSVPVSPALDAMAKRHIFPFAEIWLEEVS